MIEYVTMFLMKRTINTFDVLTFIQMHTDENKFWQIRNASRKACVQVRRDFNKRLCKKSCRLSYIACANKFLIRSKSTK